MTIEHYIQGKTAILPGEWVCRNSLYSNGLCSTPAQVIKISGSRLYFLDDGVPCHCHIRSVVFVCSTHEEGLEMLRLSDTRRQEIERSRKEVIDRFNKIIGTIISKSQQAPSTTERNV